MRAERDAPALKAMKRLAAQYPRYGYRRIRIFLRREGFHMSRYRGHRLWQLAALQLPRRRRRRRAASSRPRPIPASGANHVWAYDFVFDACANGQSLKCLTIIDEFSRESLAIDVAGSIRCGTCHRSADAPHQRARRINQSLSTRILPEATAQTALQGSIDTGPRDLARVA